MMVNLWEVTVEMEFKKCTYIVKDVLQSKMITAYLSG